MNTDDPTEEWLQAANERYRQRQLLPRGRPFEALSELARERNSAIRFDSPVANRVFAWFKVNTKEGSHAIGALFTGAFYYDACFWPVTIPIAYGTFRLRPFDSLQSMPAAIKAGLGKDQMAFKVCLAYWVDCFDFALGIDEILKGGRVAGTARAFLENGEKELTGAITQLLAPRPNLKAILGFGMACEIFLKTFLIAERQLAEKDLKKLSHNITACAKECFGVKALPEFETIAKSASAFPEVSDRYDGRERKPSEVFDAAFIAQFV